MPIIEVTSKKCKIIDEFDHDFLTQLDFELSFFVQGAEHSKAFKGFRDRTGKTVTWDGRKRLLSKKLEFKTGLLDRVINFYNQCDREVIVKDSRPVLQHHPIDISEQLEEIKKIPFDYQNDIVEKSIIHRQGIIKASTGSGKSLVSALVTAKIGKSTIIYVISKDLLYQSHDLFSKLFGKVGIIGDGHAEVENINVATIWTVGQALGLKVKQDEECGKEKSISESKYDDIRKMLKDTKVHLIDECHIAACDTIQSICDYIEPDHIYGMSASPVRDDGADLMVEASLGNVIVNYPAKYFIDRGYLAKPIIKFINVPELKEKLPKNYKTVYNKYIVENEVRNNMIVEGAKSLVKQGYKVLVSYQSIKHGKILESKISEHLNCALLSGKDSSEERGNVKKRLEEDELDCIIASRIFDIGVDLPSLSGLIIASGGKSQVRAIQRIGRVIRRYPGKKQAAIIDFIDNAKFLEKHSKIRKKIYQLEEFEIIWPKKRRKGK